MYITALQTAGGCGEISSPPTSLLEPEATSEELKLNHFLLEHTAHPTRSSMLHRINYFLSKAKLLYKTMHNYYCIVYKYM